MNNVYVHMELISGFMLGIELAEDEYINYILIDIGFVRINLNWDKEANDN